MYAIRSYYAIVARAHIGEIAGRGEQAVGMRVVDAEEDVLLDRAGEAEDA